MGLINCAECNKQISEKAGSCPNCGHPLASSDQPAAEQKSTSKPEKKSAGIGCGGFLIAIFVILVILIAIGSGGSGGGSSTPKYAGPSESMAWQMTQDFVEKRLNSPSTAEFPRLHEINDGITKTGNEYTINAYVDAQNGFGAQIRQRFTVSVRYDGQDKWSLIDIEFE